MPVIQKPESVPGAVLVKPIPERMNQVGATCGLYALSIVIRFWAKLAELKGKTPTWKEPETRGPKNALTLKEKLNAEIIERGKQRTGQTSVDPLGTGVKFTGVQKSALDLLSIAETLGSRVGEVFDCDSLALIAKKSGLDASVTHWDDTTGLFEVLKHRIDQNIPCIVCYDNTDSGDPGSTTHGARAHWAVIFGYVETPSRWLLATHGWGNYYLWNAESLRVSNEQLDHFGKWGTWYRTDDQKGNVNWDGPGVPKLPTALPNPLPDSVTRHKPKDAVAAFHISHELDVKRQFVTVLPPDTMDFEPPKNLGVTTTTTGTGKGHTF